MLRHSALTLFAALFAASVSAQINYYPPATAGASSAASIKSLYGAVGNGVADDSAAFTAAYAALAAYPTCGGSGGVLYLPAGTYIVSGDLSWMCTATGMIRLTGDSSGGTNGANGASTIIKYTGSGTFLTSRHLQLEHVRIETTSGAVAVKLDRCNKDCWIDDVNVSGFSTYGIDVSSASSQYTTSLSRLRVIGNGGWGIFVSANRTTIRDSEINTNTSGGILVDNAAQISIKDNAIETNTGPGLRFATHKSRAVVIEGNYFEGNGSPQVDFASGGGADGIMFIGNYLNGLSTVNTGVDCTACGDGFFAGNNSLGHVYGYTFPNGYRNTVIDTSPGSNTNDYNATGSRMTMIGAKGIDLPVLTFANLVAFAGRLVYCSDCTETDPCAGSGAGAVAMRVAAKWDCN